jgi:rhodanese-related sulfurtransferase
MRKLLAAVFCMLFFGGLTLIAQELPQFNIMDELIYGEYIMMPETLLYMMRQGEEDFLLYDVRSKADFEQLHIKGASNYSWDDQRFHINVETFPQDVDIIIISEEGVKSLEALKYLIARGFTQVYSIEGGMVNWLYKDQLVRDD